MTKAATLQSVNDFKQISPNWETCNVDSKLNVERHANQSIIHDKFKSSD